MRAHRFSDSKGNPVEGVRPSFKMHPEQHAAVVKAAKAQGRSVTDFMLSAIEAALQKGGKK